MIFYFLFLFSWYGVALTIITVLLTKLSLRLFSHKKNTQYGYYIPYIIPLIVSFSYWYETISYIRNVVHGYLPPPPYYFPAFLFTPGMLSYPSDGEYLVILLLTTIPVNLIMIYVLRQNKLMRK